MRTPLLVIVLLLSSTAAYADRASNGPRGARAIGATLPNGLPLNGAGVGIGQVEHARAGKPGQDTAEEDHNDAIQPYKTFGSVIHVFDGHATSVAGVMIAKDTLGAEYVGIAPQAALYSSGWYPPSFDQDIDIMNAAMDIVKDTTGPKARAINMSFGGPLTGFDVPDGNSPVTQFVDWSAAKHDILYVVGGNADYTPSAPSPADNFNGITVGGSSYALGGNTWRQISSFNVYDEDVDAFGDRVSVDILAPGEHYLVGRLGG